MTQPPTYLITGAFGALGGAVARQLHEQGARLVLVDAAAQPPAALGVELAGHCLIPGTDLTQAQMAQNVAGKVSACYGQLDGLIHLAGGFAWETMADGHPETWERMYSLNVITAVHLSQATLPLLKQSLSGRIIHIGAAAAQRAGCGMGAYAAAKTGLLRLTEAMAEELKPDGITVNAILPSIIDTPANRRSMPEADFTQWVQAASIAHAIAFLLSPHAQDITGAAIPITGRL